ncbi:unnamed protein product [Bursaphelenchus okinawaensis]|uniref:Copper transport protein ATOX1 n=1 Tax=Bursaphelenchus okinawaensis TaxID=465554 RepID=A0A811LMN2_9BILA|nr:unnamed protein product [Bursaphelenchus okinawaensis]CAG9126440.1 unnamed protein product [Bursaphelenchus okinawaensis]
MAETYDFSVAMTCEGCANAVRRVLGKLGDKVQDVKIDVVEKKVSVTTTATKDEIRQQLEKTGKDVSAL